MWDELGSTPIEFVLYGGTALALRLGHRQSEDFDFFSTTGFDELLRQIPYLSGARIDRFQPNTLTCAVDRGGEVKVSFCGGLEALSRVNDPDHAPDTGLAIASLLDVAAMKVQVVQVRAAYKDYFDIATLIDSGVSLASALAAALAVYGPRFNPMVSLKALNYFGDGDLTRLSPAMRQVLMNAVAGVDLNKLPILSGKVGLVS